MSKTVTITVSGPAGSGKTTILAIIQEALNEYGCSIEVDNPDGDVREPRLLEDVDVQLNERQTPRKCPGK